MTALSVSTHDSRSQSLISQPPSFTGLKDKQEVDRVSVRSGSSTVISVPDSDISDRWSLGSEASANSSPPNVLPDSPSRPGPSLEAPVLQSPSSEVRWRIGPRPQARPFYLDQPVQSREKAQLPVFFVDERSPWVTVHTGRFDKNIRPALSRSEVRQRAHTLYMDRTVPRDALLKVWICDDHFERSMTLGYWHTIAGDAKQLALLDCMWNLSPTLSLYPSDGELLTHAISAACFFDGTLVRRDIEAAHRLIARIAPRHIGRAQMLARTYLREHQLLDGLSEYFSADNGIFAHRAPDAPRRTSWFQPLAWAATWKSSLFWFIENIVYDQEDG